MMRKENGDQISLRFYLVIYDFCNERKLRYFYFKSVFRIEIHQQIVSLHRTNSGTKRHIGKVVKFFSRINFRCHTYYTIPGNFSYPKTYIINLPFPFQELYRDASVVLNSDMVREDITFLYW